MFDSRYFSAKIVGGVPDFMVGIDNKVWSQFAGRVFKWKIDQFFAEKSRLNGGEYAKLLGLSEENRVFQFDYEDEHGQHQIIATLDEIWAIYFPKEMFYEIFVDMGLDQFCILDLSELKAAYEIREANKREQLSKLS